ncbi:hypothetical protein EDD11_009041 [Mortierella claussenii]|nr:hypothetical protein EDD11_009041 [Mortierella claussenii]
MVAAGAFSNNTKAQPAAATPALTINIPASALTALSQASNTATSPSTPPLLSSSVSSVTSFDSFNSGCEDANTAADHARRLSQEFFFPNQTKFESAVPVVIRARDLQLKDHPIIEGAYAEYELLYNADSLMTKDGKQMVRLL